MRRTIVGVLLLFTAGAAVAAAVAPRQVTLRWKYSAGTELVYRQTVSTATEMPGMGTTTSEQVTTSRWELLEVANNGDATMTITTDRVQMSMDGPMGAMSFDSASGQGDVAPHMKVLLATVGTTYTVVLGPNGELRSLAGMEELRQRVRESMADEEAAAMLEQALDRSMSDDAMKSMFRQGIQSFPERQLVAGDTWDVGFALEMGLMGAMKTDVTFTLDSIEDRNGVMIALISTLGTLELTPDADNPVASMAQFGNATMIGTMEFDVDRGLLVKNTTSTNMELTLNIGDQEQVIGTIGKVTMELVNSTS